MKMYALVFTGTEKCVMIEEGLFYGSPTESTYFTFYTKSQMEVYLDNSHFMKNISDGKVEIKEVEIVFGESPALIPIMPPAQAIKYRLS